MHIYGVDFTSAPTKRKPITCARCYLAAAALSLEQIEFFTDFSQFEQFLRRAGPWVAGLDFPFGQPRRLVEALNWPQPWHAYVRMLSDWRMGDFIACLDAYRNQQPSGDKHHKRAADTLSGGISPMMLYGVPVGKMFFRGAPRLLNAGVRIVPCHPLADTRVVIEAYPALVASIWADGPYKSDTKSKQTVEKAYQRQKIVHGILTELSAHYHITLNMSAHQEQSLIDDPSGDRLDAVLAAIQAAWGSSRENFGISPDADPLEGWISDPALLQSNDAVEG